MRRHRPGRPAPESARPPAIVSDGYADGGPTRLSNGCIKKIDRAEPESSTLALVLRTQNVTEFGLAARGARIKDCSVLNVRRGSGFRTQSDARRVLIVDDNHDSAELLSLVLERQGHETCVVHHPEEAIAAAVQFVPTLAFVDIGLPGMDGYALLGILRSLPELQGCRFVAVTGYAELSVVPGLRGFDEHLVKPIDLSRVIALVGQTGDVEPASAKPVTA